MNLISEAKKFADLSIKYRQVPASRESTLKEIDALIRDNVQRIAMNFNITLDKQVAKFDKGHGIMMFTQSIPVLVAKKGFVQRRDLTTFNVKKERNLTGVNILLDYSGSMWFWEGKDVIAGVQRIHCQNFFALCLAHYLQAISRGSLKILMTAVGEFPVQIVKATDMNLADIDGLLVSNEWGSGEYRPKFYDEHSIVTKTYCNSEHPREALEASYAYFNKESYKSFLTLFITDGGMHRIGETEEDRERFLTKCFESIATDEKVVFFMLIKTQTESTKQLLSRMRIPMSACDTREQYDGCFDYITSFINSMVR